MAVPVELPFNMQALEDRNNKVFIMPPMYNLFLAFVVPQKWFEVMEMDEEQESELSLSLWVCACA